MDLSLAVMVTTLSSSTFPRLVSLPTATRQRNGPEARPEPPKELKWYQKWKEKLKSKPASPTSPIVPPPQDLCPASDTSHQPPSPPPQPDLGEGQRAGLQHAINDPEPIIHEAPDGSVIAGTMVGLVGRLVDFPGKSVLLRSGDHSITSRADPRRSAEYRDIFLSTFVAWTDSQTVYRLLVQKNSEAEKSPIEVQARIQFK